MTASRADLDGEACFLTKNMLLKRGRILEKIEKKSSKWVVLGIQMFSSTFPSLNGLNGSRNIKNFKTNGAFW